jgi:hypothetical protein
MSRNSNLEKVRVNFELTPALKESLVSLQERTNSQSITEVFRRALALLDMVTEHHEKGGHLILRHKDGQEEKVRLIY